MAKRLHKIQHIVESLLLDRGIATIEETVTLPLVNFHLTANPELSEFIVPLPVRPRSARAFAATRLAYPHSVAALTRHMRVWSHSGGSFSLHLRPLSAPRACFGHSDRLAVPVRCPHCRRPAQSRAAHA